MTAIVSMAIGVAVGLLADGLSDPEPLLRFSEEVAAGDGADSSRACARGHWRNTAHGSDFWVYETRLELGAPSHTLRAAVHFDLSAEAALLAKGLAQADVDALLAAFQARRAALLAASSPNTPPSFGVLLVASEELAVSLVNDARVVSRDLADCETPVATLPLSVCTDSAVFVREPHAALPRKSEDAIAFLVLPRAYLGLEAQRQEMGAELFLEAGGASASTSDAAFGVAAGASLLCFDDGDHPHQTVPAVVRGSTYELSATRDPTTGALVTTQAEAEAAVPASQAASCAPQLGAPGTPITTVALLPARTSDARATLGSVSAVGLSDADSFRAAACGADVAAATMPVATLACAAASGANCVTGGTLGVLPLAAVAERGLLVRRDNGTGAGTAQYTVTIGAERSRAYVGLDELTLAALRLVLLLSVSLVADQRARKGMGISATQVLDYALAWIGGRSPLATVDDGDGPTGVGPKGAAAHRYAAAVLMSALRVAQFALTYEARLANRMAVLIVADLVSICLSAFVTLLRLGTRTESTHHERAVHGGSTWCAHDACISNNGRLPEPRCLLPYF